MAEARRLESVIRKERLQRYKEVGAAVGVAVTVIANEGEQYTHVGKRQTYTGPVSPGCVFIAIETPDQESLNAFWKRIG